MTSIHLNKIKQRGQVVWYDNVSRDIIQDGSLQKLINEGVSGLTSNPTIFEKAVGQSNAYDAAIKELMAIGMGAHQIVEELCARDVGDAADLLRPIWENTMGVDGYASIEVNPELAGDTEGTIETGRRIYNRLARPNVMIKVPATPAGLPAIATLLEEGIPVNVTLIFSVEVYEQVAQTYLDAMKKRLKKGELSNNISSVASFFVSRLDVAVSKALAKLGKDEGMFEGQVSIANCRLAYGIFEHLFQSEDLPSGTLVQKPLWASTGSKSARLSPTFYVQKLLAPFTVNTMPPQTLEACLSGFEEGDLLSMSLIDARKCIGAVEEAGVELGKVLEELTVDGVLSFQHSYRSLVETVERKCREL